MNSSFTRTLALGTRPSALARWQTGYVSRLLEEIIAGIETRQVLITTEGDRVLDKPLPEIGGKGLFTSELERALKSGEIDLVIHSLKDLPVEAVDGLVVAAIPARADAHDVLISPAGCTLETLPHGARVGTSSLRRSAQLLIARPDLILLPLRGNVDTRIRKAVQGDYDAIVLAAAGVQRLNLDEHISEIIPFDQMLPAPGQGALAVQCRAEDQQMIDWLARIDHAPTRAAVEAERAFLLGLGGGCSAPVAAYAEWKGDSVALEGLAAAPDGSRAVRVSGSGADPIQLGRDLAQLALAQGAGAWL